MSSNGTVVPPGDGREVRIGPNRLQVKADGATGHRQVRLTGHTDEDAEGTANERQSARE
jgi:hypothetical protein